MKTKKIQDINIRYEMRDTCPTNGRRARYKTCLYSNLKSLISYLSLLSLISYLLSPICLYAAGKTSSEFLLIPKGARVSAMAGAFTSVADDSTALFYNPAGMGFLKGKNVLLSHSEWLEDINFEIASCVLPLKNKFSLGIGFEYLGISGIKGKESMNSPITEFNSYSLSLVAGVSYLFNKNISFGLNTRYIEEKIDDEKSEAVAVDVGCLYKKRINSHKSFSAGITFQNIPLKKPQFIDDKEDLPTKIVPGISYRPLGDTLLLSSDFVFMKGSKPSVNFGTEILIYDSLNLRAGYKLDPSYENLSRITCGVGVLFESLSVDYAYLPFESLTDTHIFSLGFKFD